MREQLAQATGGEEQMTSRGTVDRDMFDSILRQEIGIAATTPFDSHEGATRCDPVAEALARREISFEVLGTPAPKGSVRAFYKAGMKRAVIVKDNDAKQRSWDASVRDQALLTVGDRSEPVFVQKAIAIEIEFRLARPSGHWSAKGGLRPSAPPYPATSRFDWDKLSRSTCDALKGVIYDDDGRIVDAIVRKRYAQPGREGARITIREAT